MHTQTKPYQEAAKTLIRLGYQPAENPGSIISPLYVRGEETLYLYRPILDDSYVYVPGLGENWSITVETSTVYYPPSGDPARPGRPWVERDYASHPLVFGVRDAAEHLGLSESAIRAALYRRERNPLNPTQQIGGRIVFSDADLYKWAQGRQRGTPPSPRYRSRALLETMSRERLTQMAEAAIRRGDMSVADVAPLLKQAGYTEIEGSPLDDIISALRKMERAELVGVLAR